LTAVDVRFSGQALYCHLSRVELQRLVCGRSVDLHVAFPRNHVFRLSLRPSNLDADRGGWQLQSDPTGIWLSLPRTELDQFGQSESFAERLVHSFPVSDTQQVQVILEVAPPTQAEARSVLEITPEST
jgi:hypothetical protein